MNEIGKGQYMEKKVLFEKTLEDIKSIAKEQRGIISREQVDSALSPLFLTSDQMQMVYDYLEKNAIGIGEPTAIEDYLNAEEKDYLAEYEEELRSLPQATEGEKEAVFLSSMAGDTASQKRLIEIFLPQVPDIAKIYMGQGVLFEDLIGQGNMAISEGVGMLGAMENAKEAEGLLIRMIMDAMEEIVRESYEISKTDEQILSKVNEISSKAKELATEMRRKVTPKELAEETNISEEDIWEAYQMSGYAMEDIDGGRS